MPRLLKLRYPLIWKQNAVWAGDNFGPKWLPKMHPLIPMGTKASSHLILGEKRFLQFFLPLNAWSLFFHANNSHKLLNFVQTAMSIFTQKCGQKRPFCFFWKWSRFLGTFTLQAITVNQGGYAERTSCPSPTATTSTTMADFSCVSRHQILFDKQDVNYKKTKTTILDHLAKICRSVGLVV